MVVVVVVVIVVVVMVVMVVMVVVAIMVVVSAHHHHQEEEVPPPRGQIKLTLRSSRRKSSVHSPHYPSCSCSKNTKMNSTTYTSRRAGMHSDT